MFKLYKLSGNVLCRDEFTEVRKQLFRIRSFEYGKVLIQFHVEHKVLLNMTDYRAKETRKWNSDDCTVFSENNNPLGLLQKINVHLDTIL